VICHGFAYILERTKNEAMVTISDLTDALSESVNIR
jgi:hypothetical protein